MSLILDLLAIANDIHDKKARELVRAAALRLGQLQWHAEAPTPAYRRRGPVIQPMPPSPAGRTGGTSTNGNRHA
jgi:hypothetical protein